MTKINDNDVVPVAPDGDFAVFNLHEKVMRGVTEAGFRVPSPVQQQAIPHVMAGKDVVAQAHTGTGKTAAFGLPALHRIATQKKTGVTMLVIAPTRELANQVSDEIYKLGQFVPVQTVAVYGGQSYTRQIESIKRGAQIISATPGRLLDLLESGRIKPALSPDIVVLDEADEMLDMGFLDDIKKIFKLLPGEERQTLLFSATMPKPIQQLAESWLKEPVMIKMGGGEATNRDIEQFYYVLDERERDDATVRLIDSMDPESAVVFCRTKREVDRVAGILAGRGILAQALHGDMEQPMRERVIAGFRNADFTVLVATDVAARGIDVPGVTHVFNYHIPFDTESYVHRIGRTGRAGRKGVAITFVTPNEYQGMRRIESKVGRIQHRLIPTHNELQAANETKIIESIRTAPANEQAERILDNLVDEMGLAQAAHKLVSLLLEQETVTGPDKIGVVGERLNRLQNPPPGSRPSGGGFKPGGRGPGGPGRGRPRPGGYDDRPPRGAKSGGGYKGRDERPGGGKPYGAASRPGGPKPAGAKPSGGYKPSFKGGAAPPRKKTT